MGLIETFGPVARSTRIRLDLTQQALADAIGISRGYVAKIERGRANVSVDTLELVAQGLGMTLELMVTGPLFLADRPIHDLVHARCGEAIGRRLRAAGWEVLREVEVTSGRVHGWIDILAFHPRTRTMLIIEIKTRLDDVGGLQRQLGWYERHLAEVARRQGWVPRDTSTWLIGLASQELEQALTSNRSYIDEAFSGRAAHMLDVAAGVARPVRRAVALIDPTSRRSAWLLRTRLDGRRSPAPFQDYAAAAGRMAGR
jgi:transcriptional regulator with XRE-family HTH domain